jgi:proteasome lid subunit RPN8/RPN11
VLYFLQFQLSNQTPHRGGSGEVLILDPGVDKAVREHTESGYPREVCGLLLGLIEVGSEMRRVAASRPAANLNLERTADRYELNPADFLRIENEARSRELEVVGVYHSHPDHPSRPSETDRLRAEEIWQTSDSWSYLILEVASGRMTSRRSWVLRQGVFEEEEVQVLPFRR